MAGNTNDKDEEPTELRNLTVSEISLVDRAATKRVFLLLKHAQGGRMPELSEEAAVQLEADLNTAAANEDAVLAALKKAAKADLSDAAVNAVKAAIRLLTKHSTEIGPSIIKNLTALAGFGFEAPETKADEKKEDATVKKDEPKPDPAKAVAKAAELPEEVVALAKAGDYETIIKAASENAPLTGVFVALLKAKDVDIADLRKWQAEQIAKADDADAKALVAELNLPGAATEDQVALVKGMTPDQREKFRAFGTGLKANIAKGVFAEDVGSGRRGEFAESAYTELLTRARERVAKSTDKMTETDAIQAAMAEDPELARRYIAETRRRED